MPVTFIGDVHGWSDRLDRVLARAEGTLVFMGDLIDRGPDAPGVLERVHRLCTDGRALCLIGNHEYALVRSIGSDTIGIEPDPDFFEAWRDGFGGAAVLAAYGVATAEALRERLGPLLDWITLLPWVLEGEEAGQHWIAVHAGLSGNVPFADQMDQLRSGWRGSESPPEALFSKERKFSLPPDLPAGYCVVSGHTPLPQAFVSQARILCDTSGGQKHRQLSGVVWPEGRVVES